MEIEIKPNRKATRLLLHVPFIQKRKCFSRKKADLVLDIGGMYNGFEESIFQAVKNSEQEVEKR